MPCVNIKVSIPPQPTRPNQPPRPPWPPQPLDIQARLSSHHTILYLFHLPSPPVLFFLQSYPPPFKVVISAHGWICASVNIAGWRKYPESGFGFQIMFQNFEETCEYCPNLKHPDEFPNPIASDSKRASWVASAWVRHVSIFVVAVRVNPYVRNLRREWGFKNLKVLDWINWISSWWLGFLMHFIKDHSKFKNANINLLPKISESPKMHSILWLDDFLWGGSHLVLMMKVRKSLP